MSYCRTVSLLYMWDMFHNKRPTQYQRNNNIFEWTLKEFGVLFLEFSFWSSLFGVLPFLNFLLLFVLSDICFVSGEFVNLDVMKKFKWKIEFENWIWKSSATPILQTPKLKNETFVV